MDYEDDDDNAADDECKPCPYNCRTCSDAETCITCYENVNRGPETANCPCFDGYFENANLTCEVCHFKCGKCDETAHNCIEYCAADRLDSGLPLCNICPSTYFDNNTTAEC
jgi:proprotein convertase subtilisin/kexin type 5